MDRREEENRLDEMIDLVEKHTRTERHLEQYEDISSPENIKAAKELQNIREESISNLKDKLVYGDGGPTDEEENIIKNMKYTGGYIKENLGNMNDAQLENMKKKQLNRQEQLNSIH
ncbi:hypothetical protein [uncultured Clostridium sp.]|uniref:hypothetical protein n=1 Tax=uncultured Clostridium sp. TaxID=59620 RepID=UPI0028EEDAA3|nr:hypothetical protein [uncultured Clostridium sp.]